MSDDCMRHDIFVLFMFCIDLDFILIINSNKRRQDEECNLCLGCVRPNTTNFKILEYTIVQLMALVRELQDFTVLVSDPTLYLAYLY